MAKRQTELYFRRKNSLSANPIGLPGSVETDDVIVRGRYHESPSGARAGRERDSMGPVSVRMFLPSIKSVCR